MFERDDLFWFCALSGSGLFLIQFVLFFIGADTEDDSSSQNFKWLSKQTITGFLMMFGWVGLACKRELGFSPLFSTAIAIGFGTLAMIVTAAIFNFARKLRSTGTVFRLQDAIGKEASVYQRIPKGSAGKISLSLHEMTHEIDAISLNGEEIDSFTQVQIIKKADDRTVVVIPIG